MKIFGPRGAPALAAVALVAASFYALAATGENNATGSKAQARGTTSEQNAQAPSENVGPDSATRDGDIPADTLEQRVAACTSCHGKKGGGAVLGNTYYPRLANQSKTYLFKQLKDFRAAQREGEVMQRIVQKLPDAYLEEIAGYFAKMDPPYVPANERLGTTAPDAATLERGHILVTRGKPEADVPACTRCHGPQLLGVTEPERLLAPRIVAQYAPYISAQLQSWLAGTRRNDPAGVMQGITERLNDADRSAIAAYLAQTEPGAVEIAASTYARHLGRAPELDAASAEQRALIERGRYLALAGDCVACHTAPGGQAFAGGLALSTPYGVIYSPNITPDEQTGIGRYSADDFWQVMHHGKLPNGSYLYPAMPFTAYTNVKRADSDAIYAYLMSHEPVHKAREENTFGWPFSMRALMLGWRILFFEAATFEPDPNHSEQWNRGAYLTEALGHCGSCHTPRNKLGAQISDRHLAGAYLNGWYAPNITSDPEHGIGDWSVEEIATFLKTGKVKGKTHVFASMKEVVYDSTQHMPMNDLRAIATYLKSVPAQQPQESEAEEKNSQPKTFESENALYADHCAGCHGDDGEGQWPAYPPMANNPALAVASPINLIRVISEGGFSVATEAHPRPYSMPPFKEKLSAEQIAEIVTFIRAKWGERYRKVTAEQVINGR